MEICQGILQTHTDSSLQDIFTDDEMFSDAFEFVEKHGGIVYEVDCRMEQRGKGVQVNTGANASAEGGEEQLDDGVETVNNIIANFELCSTVFSLDSYSQYLKCENSFPN